MSAGRLARFLADATKLVMGGLIGWLLIAPFAMLMPRRRDRLIVIGMGDGKFIDNTKYFYLQGSPLLQPNVQATFLTGHNKVAVSLSDEGLDVLRYPSWRSAWALLRCSVVVVDSGDWLSHMRRFLLIGAKTVQLWHGANLKRIGLDKMRHEASRRKWLSSPWVMRLRMLNGALNGKLVRYSVVVSPSNFYDREVFRKAIPARHYLVTGYPRNTFGKVDPEQRRLVWLNVDHVVADAMPAWAARERRIVLVAPTFRDSRPTALGLDAATLTALDAWCEARGAEFVFKFHPFERGTASIAGKHLHLCDPDSDIYPLMPLSHALVTDYSSIYMDYLLLDKPVLFLVPDMDEYIQHDRQLQFDFNEMAPGPKLQNWTQLLEALDAQWHSDDFVTERARLRQLAFDGLDQREAVPKLIAFMRAQHWIADRGG